MNVPAARHAVPAARHGVPAAAPALLPSRADPRGTEPLVRLFEEPPRPWIDARGGLDGELLRRYDGDLRIPLRPDRPTVVANFVETLDGVVAMDRRGVTGGGEVSGFSPTDRFVMGLLRALADVVLVGAATIRSSRRATWTPGGIFPEADGAYAALRGRLGLAPAPTTLIATASGDLDPALPVFEERGVPIVIAGPRRAVDQLRRASFGANVAIERVDGEGADAVRAIVDLAGSLGARIVLSEAGPHLFAALTEADLVDELFLTVAPQLAGRADDTPRLAMIEGAALWPARPRWTRLASAGLAGNHLFLRYHLEERI